MWPQGRGCCCLTNGRALGRDFGYVCPVLHHLLGAGLKAVTLRTMTMRRAGTERPKGGPQAWPKVLLEGDGDAEKLEA